MTSEMNTQNTSVASPVVIVGGGMVGLTLSLLLSRFHIPSILIEHIQYPQADDVEAPLPVSFDSRNTALSRKTVLTYTQLGLWPLLQPYATPIHTIHISEQGAFGKATLRHTQEQVDDFGQVIENAWLGRQLLKAVRADKNIGLYDGVQVTALEQNAQRVRLTCQQVQGVQEPFVLESALVIAADGRDSFCRQALGILVDAKDYGQTALVTVVETSKPHDQVAYERFTPEGPLALLPLVGEHRRAIVWTVASHRVAQFMGAENDSRFLDALQTSFGDRAGQFVRTGARAHYPLSQVLAHQQSVGRVVLMGNAAHTLHPVAGQGFNLCIRDAITLAEMLGAQQRLARDLGDTAVLKEYERARLSDQKRVILFCDSVVRGFSNHNVALKLARNIGLLGFDMLPGLKPLLAHYAMGLKQAHLQLPDAQG